MASFIETVCDTKRFAFAFCIVCVCVCGEWAYMWGRREDIKGCCPVTQLHHEYHYSNHIAMNIIIGSATLVVFVTLGVFNAHHV